MWIFVALQLISTYMVIGFLVVLLHSKYFYGNLRDMIKEDRDLSIEIIIFWPLMIPVYIIFILYMIIDKILETISENR